MAQIKEYSMMEEDVKGRPINKDANRLEKRLTVDVVKNLVPKTYKGMIDEPLVETINRLSDDPTYGDEFKESFITYTTVLNRNTNWGIGKYLDAIKFHSLSTTGISLVDAYCLTFPDRLARRIELGKSKAEMTGEAARYNKGILLNAIREQALVPLHLVNQGTTQLAINTLTKLMLTARSEVAKVSAATALLKELRPPEAQQVELQIGLSDEVTEMHKKQTDSLLQIAENQRKMLEAGHSIEDVQRINATIVEADIDE